MSNGHLSVQCIELLQRGVQGPLGYVRVYVHGLCNTWGLVRVIGIEGMCQGLHRDTVHKPDPRLVLWVRQVAVASYTNLY